MVNGHGLGLREPGDRPRPMIHRNLMGLAPATVNKKLDVPYEYRLHYDQGMEGACVGFGYSWMMSFLNRRKYDANWLYHEAQLIDPWADTPPQEGTSEQAGAEILITKGHRRIYYGFRLPALSEGISAVRFADYTNAVNEIRAAINAGVPVGLAMPWFEAYDRPVWTKDRGWVIGDSPELGAIRGWHFICCYGARDQYDSIELINSWGLDYPLVKMPYRTVERMADMGASFAIITDR